MTYNQITFILCMFIINSNLFAMDSIDILLKDKWISDKIQTIEWINVHRPTLKGKEKIFELFGRMIVLTTRNEYITEVDGKKNTSPIKILGNTDRVIALVINDPNLKRDVIVVIEIDEDKMGYWTYNSQFDIKEHFIKFKNE